MTEKIVSVFVDESGKFQYPDKISRFYIVALVFHDQTQDVMGPIARLDSDWQKMGLFDFCFHAGPLLRKEKGYMYMSRLERTAIFSRMMSFSRQIPFEWHCLVVDKEFITSSRQIIERLQGQLADFLEDKRTTFDSFDRVKLYYDCGQTPITELLHDTFAAHIGPKLDFAQAVRPRDYKLFQIADLICTVKLLETKLKHGIPFKDHELKFFGSIRNFRRNILKQLKAKEML